MLKQKELVTFKMGRHMSCGRHKKKLPPHAKRNAQKSVVAITFHTEI